MATLIAGPREVTLPSGTTLTADLISEITVSITQAMRERTTMAGTFRRNAGTIEENTATFSIFLPSIDYLQYIVPEQYEAGTITWGASTCLSESGPVTIHDPCAEDDANDIFWPNADLTLNFNPTFNATDEVTIEVTVNGQPDENGVVAQAGPHDES